MNLRLVQLYTYSPFSLVGKKVGDQTTGGAEATGCGPVLGYLGSSHSNAYSQAPVALKNLGNRLT